MASHNSKYYVKRLRKDASKGLMKIDKAFKKMKPQLSESESISFRTSSSTNVVNTSSVDVSDTEPNPATQSCTTICDDNPTNLVSKDQSTITDKVSHESEYHSDDDKEGTVAVPEFLTDKFRGQKQRQMEL